jgi:general secretion pathway protein A
MYESFFGLRDQPFRLTPDPRYLYLGPKHREGYAHLLYALREGSGFVAIMGEVGTGKTTLVRALLNENRENIAVAYIFNPVLSSIELLQTINAEFGIAARSTSKKELTDALNAFLIAQKTSGGRAVIIVDEAQNLDPAVLEQLRLLSNLETETAKLLQIVLLGQPELSNLLDRPELRQLSQRVALRWQLDPLGRNETRKYLEHRIRVAGGGAALLQPAAIVAIYEHTGGIPRLINVLAHRALLVAYTRGTRTVGAAEVSSAVTELEEGKVPLRAQPRRATWQYKVAAGAGVAIAAVVVAFLLVAPLGPEAPKAANDSQQAEQPPQPRKEKAQRRAPDERSPEAAPVDDAERKPNSRRQRGMAGASDAEDFGRQLARSSAYETASGAMSRLIELWTGAPLAPTEIASGTLDLQLLGARRGLRYLAAEMSVELLTLIDLPAVLELEISDGGEVRYALLERYDDGSVVLRLDRETTVSADTVNAYWTGRAHLLWRDAERLSRALIPGTEGPAVSKLQQLLAEAGSYQGDSTGVYDEKTQNAVQSFQSAHGLVQNGVAGIVTQIVLYNALGRFERPRLRPPTPNVGAAEGESAS